MPFSRSRLRGFPFDRSCNREESLRSTLDDIAKRHPEFAEHLDTFTHRGGQSRAPRLADDPDIDDCFEGGAFREPFGGFSFAGRERLHPEEFVQRFYEPTRRGSNESQGPSRQEHAPPPPDDTAPRTDDVVAGASKPPRSTIQQSNTIDLGQKQEAVDDRNQRSMSAPPGEKGQRYTSSINIPVNQPTAGMADSHNPHVAPQQQETSRPVERIIPIQIEGRDEPIVPKKAVPAAHSAATATASSSAVPPPRSDVFSHLFQPGSAFANSWRHYVPENEQQRPLSPVSSSGSNWPFQRVEDIAPGPPPPKEEDTSNRMPEKKVQSAIAEIQKIQKQVSDLMEKVEKFEGKPRDKQYLYLDEMLTRNLIMLDNVDTDGHEVIRSSRKEAIRCIERAISVLEAKAALNEREAKEAAEEAQLQESAAEEATPSCDKPEQATSAEVEKKEEQPEAIEEEITTKFVLVKENQPENASTTTDFVLVGTEDKQKPDEDDAKRFVLVEGESKETAASSNDEASSKETGDKIVSSS